MAQQYGVQTSYADVSGQRRKASPDSLLAVLRALGCPVSGLADVGEALRWRTKHLIERRIEPVSVAWDGKAPALNFYVPRDSQDAAAKMRLQFESGEERTWDCDLSACRPIHYENFENSVFVAKELRLPDMLPYGYHTLTIESRGQSFSTRIFSAPLKLSAEPGGKIWGVFIPLYALCSQQSPGSGNFGDMARLYRWLGGLGGAIVGTLPFLAAFLDNPFEPSPYSPASRLFWNEFYLDLGGLPELKAADRARSLLESMRHELGDLRSTPLVDYRREMEVRRKVLEKLAESFFNSGAQGRVPFYEYCRENPALEDYARFRAAGERIGKPWPDWPDALRNGTIEEADFDPKSRDYHLYVQWALHRQIGELADEAEKWGPGLYLDLPLGIHPHSYDTWRYRGMFPEKVSAGAPPDMIFSRGQNWGFPPLHPEAIREDGYGYVITYISKMMRQAGVLRIDHAPGLHRIFWIPEGRDAADGVYVHYHSDEMYAILSIESHRNRCLVAGENLGTVPRYVNQAMARHNVYKMFVLQYELEGMEPEKLKPVPAGSVASLNTHDMAPFAGFLAGTDIRDRYEAGLLDEQQKSEEQGKRKDLRDRLGEFYSGKGLIPGAITDEAIAGAAVSHLAMSSGNIVLVTLEDLWMEKEPQNLPGTMGERPNWKRRARFCLEDFENRPEVVEILKHVDGLRKSVRKRK